jgi:hypothetical protein
MEALAYLLSIFAFLIGTAGLAGLLWVTIEGAYWIYCKATGREY